MNKSSFLKTTLYLGVILLLFMISKSFNSLSVLTLNNTKTIRVAQDRFKLDDLELKIKETLNNNPKRQVFSGAKIQEIDEDLIRFEQQLTGEKLPRLDSIKQKWEHLKNQSSPDPSDMINELDKLQRVVNNNLLEDIAKREAVNERDIAQFKILKIANSILIIFLTFIAMYLDTIQNKQKDLLIQKLQASESKDQDSLYPIPNSSSPENIRQILDNI
ncbi:MAG: hypothetical protein H7281_07040 [Bacteriovorax sp.]|nr:hypothetical protein [Bacteriovorax sp.]